MFTKDAFTFPPKIVHNRQDRVNIYVQNLYTEAIMQKNVKTNLCGLLSCSVHDINVLGEETFFSA